MPVSIVVAALIALSLGPSPLLAGGSKFPGKGMSRKDLTLPVGSRLRPLPMFNGGRQLDVSMPTPQERIGSIADRVAPIVELINKEGGAAGETGAANSGKLMAAVTGDEPAQAPGAGDVQPASAGDFIEVAQLSEIEPGTSKVVEVDGHDIALFNVDGKIYAVENSCPHKQMAVDSGEVTQEGGKNILMCPSHGWTFDLDSGACTNNPGKKIGCYGVKVDNGRIFIKS